jgi:hypothetical protein
MRTTPRISSGGEPDQPARSALPARQAGAAVRDPRPDPWLPERHG